ncbi:ABC-2 type transport system permease protein [Rhodococcus rhodochrous J38]|nr:ABC-2 type transport system permease protein [Rhodococcus rhodochrous J38]
MQDRQDLHTHGGPVDPAPRQVTFVPRVGSGPVSDALTVDDEPIESSSRSFRRAFQDLREGFNHRELWLLLGWQDIKQRYRRSVLGPFWITIATGVSAIAMGVLYGTLFNLDVPEFLPYVALGFIIWNLIQGSILEGADVFMSNEGLIKQLPTPLSVHVYRLVWRQMILFAHNIVIYIGIFIFFPRQLYWTAFLAIPALALIAINAVWVSLVFGILATRYRDIAPLLGSIVQLLFFMTPIIWTEKTLEGTGNEGRARIAEINPLYHFLDIVRTPLLGGDQQLYHWVIVLIITVVGWGIALLALRNYRSRVAYWV